MAIMAQNNRDEIVYDKVADIDASKENMKHLCSTLFVEASVREISSFGMVRIEGDYMLVDHKHKNNFYKTTKIHVSNDFLITDLIARNLDTRVEFNTNDVVVQ
uniref:Uncharacterized protein n=1 Tax=Lactuca sativa TaxID=4236 RepID=A0A9R1URP0_LACSA|nr:hypothetical protein LSAT_V11C800415260 [Lactuca sativa]